MLNNVFKVMIQIHKLFMHDIWRILAICNKHLVEENKKHPTKNINWSVIFPVI